jgi:hypothetical protein
MPREQKERPRPHGDPIEQSVGDRPTKDLIDNNPEENRAQRESDAQPDETVRGDLVEEPSERSDRAHGQGSDANGVPAFDEADGARRRKHYEDGAGSVSRID